jgi:hypothetical protein
MMADPDRIAKLADALTSAMEAGDSDAISDLNGSMGDEELKAVVALCWARKAHYEERIEALSDEVETSEWVVGIVSHEETTLNFMTMGLGSLYQASEAPEPAGLLGWLDAIGKENHRALVAAVFAAVVDVDMWREPGTTPGAVEHLRSAFYERVRRRQREGED